MLFRSAGGAGITGAVYAASFQGAIGNVAPSTGTFTSVTAQTETVGGLQAVAIGNVTPGTGAFTTGTFSSTLGVTGVTTLNNNLTANGNATVSGTFSASGDSSFGGVFGSSFGAATDFINSLDSAFFFNPE